MSRARAALAVARLATLVGSWAVLASMCPCAWAVDPLNSSDVASSTSRELDDRAHTQFNLLPVAGGTTDIGFGVGEFMGITRVRRGVDPYVWNLESGGLVTFKLGETGGLDVPYQDIYFKLTVPRLLGSASTLEMRPSYTSESTLNYEGLGNASSDAQPARSARSYSLYGRVHPSMSFDLHWRIVDHVAAHLGARYTQNWIRVIDGSRLAQDLRSGSPEVKRLLGATGPHGVALFCYGLQWDDRDSEVSPHKGSKHEALVRLSPGGTESFPYRYGEAKLDSRAFASLGPGRVTLALRAVGDVLFGNPPFYELARFDDAYALGGPDGVRGIPAQRYYGKVKVFANVELRGEVASFHALGKRMLFGVVAFFDGGRVWGDLTPHPELDGTQVGLKYGVGGGLRLQSGEAFLLRADVAWSPDSRPIGGYFAVGQTF